MFIVKINEDTSNETHFCYLKSRVRYQKYKIMNFCLLMHSEHAYYMSALINRFLPNC